MCILKAIIQRYVYDIPVDESVFFSKCVIGIPHFDNGVLRYLVPVCTLRSINTQ